MTRQVLPITGVCRRTRTERAMIRHTITRLLQDRSGRSAGRVIRLVHVAAMVTPPRGLSDEVSAARLLRACRSELARDIQAGHLASVRDRAMIVP